MEQEMSVLKAMDSIYYQAPELTVKEQDIITQHLRLVWAAGYDEGTKQNSHSKPVRQLKDGKEIQTYPSIIAAAKSLGIHKSSIGKNINGKTKHCHGFQWELITE